MSDTIAPALKRRFASMVYEAMLLFGVLFITFGLLSVLLQRRYPLYFSHALPYLLFLVAGIYFAWFWSRSGQTLAMKTWRMRVVDINGHKVTIGRAAFRYLLAWMWFLPGLMLAGIVGAKSWWLIAIPVVGAALWSLTIYLDPQRQFLHDRMAGTRLIKVDTPQSS